MKKLTLLILLASHFATAADFQPAPPPEDVQEALLAALKNGRNTAAMVEYIDAIATVPFSSDIYEISFKGGNNEILYVSKDGGYIFQADIIAVPDALNISRERRDALAAAKGLANTADPAPTAKSADDPPAKPGKKAGDGQFAAPATELALKEIKGDGNRRLWLMTAPDCSMCKTLEEQIGSISDVTLYRYLYTHDDSSTQRAIAITCHHNPNEALRDYLLYGLASEDKPDEPTVPNCRCCSSRTAKKPASWPPTATNWTAGSPCTKPPKPTATKQKAKATTPLPPHRTTPRPPATQTTATPRRPTARWMSATAKKPRRWMPVSPRNRLQAKRLPHPRQKPQPHPAATTDRLRCKCCARSKEGASLSPVHTPNKNPR